MAPVRMIVLAQYRGPADPETGGAFTVKRYTPEKEANDEAGGTPGSRSRRPTRSIHRSDIAAGVLVCRCRELHRWTRGGASPIQALGPSLCLRPLSGPSRTGIRGHRCPQRVRLLRSRKGRRRPHRERSLRCRHEISPSLIAAGSSSRTTTPTKSAPASLQPSEGSDIQLSISLLPPSSPSRTRPSPSVNGSPANDLPERGEARFRFSDPGDLGPASAE